MLNQIHIVNNCLILSFHDVVREQHSYFPSYWPMRAWQSSEVLLALLDVDRNAIRSTILTYLVFIGAGLGIQGASAFLGA